MEFNLKYDLNQQFPTFFKSRTPWQPICINCTLNISKIFVINTVTVISNLYVVTVDVSALFRHYSIFFFRVPLNVQVRTPRGTLTPGWESLI